MHYISTFFSRPISELKTMAIGETLTLLTYKKDRKIVITKQAEDSFHVRQDGFEKKEFSHVETVHLKQLLKQLKSVEFPKNRTYFMVKHSL